MKSNTYRLTLLSFTPLLLLACAGASTYAPKPDATAKTIFDEACSRCHQDSTKLENGSGFKISAKHQSVGYIKQQIANGSMSMPSFPNISLEDRTKLATYLLEHQ